MSKRVPIGVSRFGVLALAIVMVLPAAATANSITDPVTFATGITADGTQQTFEDVFDVDNDVALWRFFLGDGVFQFSAATTSATTGGFDPLMSLYYSAVDGEASLYHHVLYDDPVLGDQTPAIFDDVDAGDTNSAFSLTLAAPGFYILALTQAFNDHQDGPAGTPFPGMTFGWDDDATFRCQPGGICENPDTGLGFFRVQTELRPVDSTPVP
jgi:hypothetical protein